MGETGLHRAQTSMVLATALYRGSHLVAGIAGVVQHQWDRPFQWLALTAAIASSALVYATAARRGRLVPRIVWIDVLTIGCLLPFGTYLWGGAHQPASIAWVMLLGGSASAFAAAALRVRPAVAATALLVATHLLGYLLVGADAAVTGGHLNALVFSAVVSGVLWWYFRRQGALLDAANERALVAEAHRARYAERISHHRALHDTVLATLTAISAGGVDANTTEMRHRCAREAAYLRRLIEQSDDQGSGSEIRTALEESVRAAEALGLRVTLRYHEPPTVPGETALAFGQAVAEALNNVHRHAGTGHAYLTVTGDSGRLVVTVVDQGRGFDASLGSGGLGLTRSVHERMRDIGGRATVDGAPGEGVSVELRWPR
ncbi:sensor histidine kinase [Streptomyces sp. NPDC052042]|uniref:sensor histidine kinase n=1 Tax=Streptomyces sp. NPDC052042 TaxID=3365683 RepID=UPI0037CD4DDE